MKYEVLARRYRPRQFDEVVGQESVAATLQAGIRLDRVAHAYLFTGPRGVGKTSMARILAKALNCPQAADRSRPEEEWGRSCDACEACEGIHLGQDIDVIEMDAASHRGIEDVRSIIESVNRRATRSPYKVFIVDEVHMLTREAFNALLKTLEEPPAHVKFIFATTEAHRIPDTVLSRCQRFDFHAITADAIVRRLEQILAAEKREAEDGLLEKIARYGRGGLRDSQTILDQLLTYAEGPLQSDDLERITGRMPETFVSTLGDAISAGDSGVVLRELAAAFQRGADPAVLIEQVIESLREELHRRVGLGRDTAEGEAAGEAEPIDQLLAVLQILLEAAAKLRHSAYPAVAVEVALLKAARLEDPQVLTEMIERLRDLERRRGGGAPTSAPQRSPTSAPREPVSAPEPEVARVVSKPAPAPPAPTQPVPTQPLAPASAPTAAPAGTSTSATPPAVSGAVSEATATDSDSSARPPPAAESPAGEPSSPPTADCSLPQLLAVWDQITIELQEKHPQIAPLVSGVTPSLDPTDKDTVLLAFEDHFYYQRIQSQQNREALTDLVREVSRAPWQVKLIQRAAESAAETTAIGAAGTADASGSQGASSSASRPGTAGDSNGAPSGASEGIADSELVQKAKKLFNGRLL